MVEGGDSASGDLAFALANAPSHTLASKPTTDSNYSTLGTVASHSHHSHCCLLQPDSPSRASDAPFALHRIPHSSSASSPCSSCCGGAVAIYAVCRASPVCLPASDNHHCPLPLSVLPPADRRVSHEGSVLLQALCLPHHMSCYAGACECSPENIR